MSSKKTFAILVAFEVQTDTLVNAEKQVEKFIQEECESIRPDNFSDIYLHGCDEDDGNLRVYHTPSYKDESVFVPEGVEPFKNDDEATDIEAEGLMHLDDDGNPL